MNKETVKFIKLMRKELRNAEKECLNYSKKYPSMKK